jgi:hypothetical protein
MDNKNTHKADEPSDRVLDEKASKSQTVGADLNDGEGNRKGNPNAGPYSRKI